MYIRYVLPLHGCAAGSMGCPLSSPEIRTIDMHGCESPEKCLSHPACGYMYTYARIRLTVPRKQITDVTLNTCNKGNSSKSLNNPTLFYCLKCYLTHCKFSRSVLVHPTLSIPQVCPDLDPHRRVLSTMGIVCV